MAGVPDRDLNDLQAELCARGAVEASARPPRTNIVQVVFLLLWPVPVVGGVLMLLALRDEPTVPLTAAGLIAAGLALLAVALLLRRRALHTPWHTWRLDTEGLSIAGVGPLPWPHMGAVERRTVPAAYSDGNERAWVLPLTEPGVAWVEGLDHGARRLFQPAYRRGPFTGLLSAASARLTHVRLVPMQGVDSDDWRAVVEKARQRFTHW